MVQRIMPQIPSRPILPESGHWVPRGTRCSLGAGSPELQTMRPGRSTVGPRLTSISLFRLDFVLTPAILAATALLSLGIALAASVGPGLLAARLRPIEALRYE